MRSVTATTKKVSAAVPATKTEQVTAGIVNVTAPPSHGARWWAGGAGQRHHHTGAPAFSASFDPVILNINSSTNADPGVRPL